MTEQVISQLRRRMIEDMTIRHQLVQSVHPRVRRQPAGRERCAGPGARSTHAPRPRYLWSRHRDWHRSRRAAARCRGSGCDSIGNLWRRQGRPRNSACNRWRSGSRRPRRRFRHLRPGVFAQQRRQWRSSRRLGHCARLGTADAAPAGHEPGPWRRGRGPAVRRARRRIDLRQPERGGPLMFRRPSVHYGRTPEPETPYQRGPRASVTPIKSKQLRLPAV
jgi:hypothetical protein